ncbi:MAG TPA: DnaA/Hda family protein [Usitatibacter sp.]|nr:DnaA/Hda family protein [Usitatibacter sp.]
MRQLLLDLTQAPAPTFANFVHGRNAELFRALEAAAHGELAEPVLYMWGDSGAGKSHLVTAFRAATEGRPGVLAIDDLERLGEDEQAALFNAFVDRAFRLLLVTARVAPADLPLRKDLATRLATGLAFRLLPLTDEEKRAALAAHAKARGFALADEVTSYLLSHSRRDMGSLMAALDSLDRYSIETGRPITVPLLKAAMQA